ncbi:MAG: UbiD family decarboxylase [Candidatus Asgardarchaeia archaeon]
MLREFLSICEEKYHVKHVKEEVSPKYEITKYLSKYDGNLMIFEKVKGWPNPIISGLVGNKELAKMAINVKSDEELYLKMISASSSPMRPKLTEDAQFLDEVKESVDLSKLPILYHFEKDGGPYITSALVYAKDLEEGFQNVSFHRMMVLDKEHLVIRIVPRHLYKIFLRAKKAGRDLPVEIAIGLHPAVLLSASYPAEFKVDESWIANSLLDGKLHVFEMEETGIKIPNHAEIVMEGKILHDSEDEEGPFVDITGTYDIVRRQPVVEIDRIYMRKGALYHALLPSGSEHRILMGLPKEVKIWQYVKNVVPEVKGVNLTPGGCGWLHAVISIRKQSEGDPKNAIMAAFAAHPSLKHCIIVDEDIDIYNPKDVEWAIATRFQADEDLIIIKNARGSSLDPSSDQKNLITTKVGIDATIPLNKDPKDFMRAKIPEF